MVKYTDFRFDKHVPRAIRTSPLKMFWRRGVARVKIHLAALMHALSRAPSIVITVCSPYCSKLDIKLIPEVSYFSVHIDRTAASPLHVLSATPHLANRFKDGFRSVSFDMKCSVRDRLKMRRVSASRRAETICGSFTVSTLQQSSVTIEQNRIQNRIY